MKTQTLGVQKLVGRKAAATTPAQGQRKPGGWAFSQEDQDWGKGSGSRQWRRKTSSSL